MPSIVNKSTAFAHCISNHSVAITFLNHFKLKRNINSVFLAIYPASDFIPPVLIPSPYQMQIILYRPYSSLPHEANGFHIEFTSPENIGIPFPAILISL